MRIQIIFTAVVQKIEKRWQLRCKNTQHVGRQYTQNAQILTKQKTTKEMTKGQIKQR